MQINVEKKQILVGDLVESKKSDELCLIIYDKFDEVHPFRVVNLKDTNTVNGYKTLDGINADYTLVAKRDDLELKVKSRR